MAGKSGQGHAEEKSGVQTLRMTYLQSAGWFLARPGLYREMVRRGVAKLTRRQVVEPDTRAEAEAWCESHAVTTQEVLKNITGVESFDLPADAAAEFSDAEQRVKQPAEIMGGGANAALLYCLAKHVGARRVIETGVALGWSSMALLLAIESLGDGKLVSIDMPYKGRGTDAHVGSVVPQRLRVHWKLMRTTDRDGLPKALRRLRTVDMCHYDSDKAYRARMRSYPQLWRALRSGGIFLSDDIGDNFAFRDFSALVGAEPIVIAFENKFVGLMVKSTDRH